MTDKWVSPLHSFKNIYLIYIFFSIIKFCSETQAKVLEQRAQWLKETTVMRKDVLAWYGCAPCYATYLQEKTLQHQYMTSAVILRHKNHNFQGYKRTLLGKHKVILGILPRPMRASCVPFLCHLEDQHTFRETM